MPSGAIFVLGAGSAIFLLGTVPYCYNWVVEGQSGRLGFADFPNLMAGPRCFQSGPNVALPIWRIALPLPIAPDTRVSDKLVRGCIGFITCRLARLD